MSLIDPPELLCWLSPSSTNCSQDCGDRYSRSADLPSSFNNRLRLSSNGAFGSASTEIAVQSRFEKALPYV
ncbi:hypothetical protein T265_05995 [Opisthorchis viverrini]|uniref:Uncharacterized protein n=1 Tax=Opisthorchis viverrini TaxID=6198 RepID=A0A075AEM3_OPIVI|nr:hypothetical protein T265_05995 [Opisthorchis viverrini]KER26864.1 hypothetical protein T265_05995 [Opisthorchis viverrini]